MAVVNGFDAGAEKRTIRKNSGAKHARMERSKNVLEIARRLARVAVESEEAITEIYLFPDDKEIRLVELDPTTVPSGDRISPFYFPPDPRGGIPLPAGIALIQPDEKGRLPLPKEWGDWSKAVLLYRKKGLAA